MCLEKWRGYQMRILKLYDWKIQVTRAIEITPAMLWMIDPKDVQRRVKDDQLIRIVESVYEKSDDS
jgi:hypothetical protein